MGSDAVRTDTSKCGEAADIAYRSGGRVDLPESKVVRVAQRRVRVTYGGDVLVAHLVIPVTMWTNLGETDNTSATCRVR